MNTYEKKYKEALQKIRELIEKGKKNGWTIITYEKDFEEIFPELKSEDEKIRKALVEMVHDTTGDELWVDYNVHKEEALAWLKSLKDRYTWKPSDEQITALSDINLTGCISYAGQGQELINLYNDLKKLKG